MLKYVSKQPHGEIYTSGKGTIGEGAYCSAVRDELGGWSLKQEPSSWRQGNVCVEELEKRDLKIDQPYMKPWNNRLKA
jgi:DNA replicative helicase MCM subunit Mcm2 (Cdc46/Mcm family)